MLTKALSTTSTDTADNRSSSSEKKQPSWVSRSQWRTREEVSGEGMSTKKLLRRPVAEKFLSRYPAHCLQMALDRSRGFALACSSFPLVSFSCGENARRFLKLGKRFDFVATMVLSEARGLSLFLALRGGIACRTVTRCRSQKVQPPI